MIPYTTKINLFPLVAKILIISTEIIYIVRDVGRLLKH